MPEELLKLLVTIGLSLAFSILIIAPVIIWRIVRKKPIIPKGYKFESPKIFYAGILVFGIFSVLSFLTGTPYHGIVLFIFMSLYIIGLIAYNKGWRG